VELRHFRYFQAVAEELSFSKAAKRLRVAQPALSRAIKELEDDLGALLLARTRRSVALTPAGSVLLRDAATILQQVEETARRVRRTAAGEEGELRLGYIGPPTERFLGRALTEFRRRYPRVSISLQERTPERVWEMVANGRLEIGLTRPVLAEHALGLRTLPLRKEPLWGVFPRNHPLAQEREVHWRDLRDEPLIILARREGAGLYEAISRACHAEGFSPRLAYTPSLISTVLTYVEAGAGVGVMSDSVTVLGSNRPLEFRSLVPRHAVELVMVWSEGKAANDGGGGGSPAAAFRKLIGEWLREGRLWTDAGAEGSHSTSPPTAPERATPSR
jgi:DNA-binding transcriptional LysR family regulator